MESLMGSNSPKAIASAVVTIALLATSPVHAGGMEIPENGTMALSRGGAFTVLANDLTAIALNPGALTRRRGTSMYLGNTFTFSTLEFTRAESIIPEEPIAAMYNLNRTGTSRNRKVLFPLGCFIGVASDFGLEDWRFAFGAYGPSASGAQGWPKDGSQRYMLTEMEALSFYLDATVAYGKQDHYGVGISLQLALTPSISFSTIVDGAIGGQLNPYASSTDLEATLEMTAPPTVSAIVGAWWRVIPELELAVASRVIPVYLQGKGKITLANVPNTCPENDDSCLAQTAFTDEELRISDSVA
jgi:long-subunit fatty acid transport protein